MFTADSDIILELVDSDGSVVPFQKYTEDPISDIEDPNNKSGEQLSVLIFEKPSSGNYKLKVTGNAGGYSLNTYLYEIDGDVTQNNFSGTLFGSDTDTYEIIFNEQEEISIDIPAKISNVSSTTPSFDSAVITWTTDKLTKSRVVYDTVSHGALGSPENYGYGYSTSTFNSSPKVTSHTVTIIGLSAGTTYYYRTISEGSPVAIGEEKQFRTLTIASSPNQSGGNVASTIVTPLFTTPKVFQTVFVNEKILGTETEEKESPLPNTVSKPDVKGLSKNNWSVRNVILIIVGVILTILCIKLLFGRAKRSK
jgi:hypothetical protein